MPGHGSHCGEDLRVSSTVMQLRLLLLVAAMALTAAAAYAQSVDDPQQWRGVALSRALAAAEAIDDPYRRAESLASIARVQTQIGETAGDRTIHQALAAVEQIREPAFRDWVLNDVVLAQIAADDVAGARATANRIEAKRQQGAALVQIATVQLRAGNVAGAQQTAATIREREAKSEILRAIVAVSSARGDLASARDMLRDIDDPFYLALAAGDIAVAEVRAGRNERADAMVSRVRRADRAQVYGRIALARADQGDVRSAIQTLQQIDDELLRAVMQGRLAATRAVAGDGTAAQMFSTAIASVEAHQREPDRRALTLAQLGRMQAVSGDRATAVQTLGRASREAEKLERGDRREDTLDHIARGLARAGDSAGALQIAQRMDDRVARALLVRDIVTMQTSVDSSSAAASAAEFRDPLIDAAAQFGVLGMQLLRATSPVSQETIEAARRAVRKIEEKQPKPAAFAALAAARVKAGDVDQGSSIFAEALEAAEAIARNDQRAAAYVDVVAALNDRLMFLGQPLGSEQKEN